MVLEWVDYLVLALLIIGTELILHKICKRTYTKTVLVYPNGRTHHIDYMVTREGRIIKLE